MERELLNERQFDKFRSFIYEQSGIRVDDRKISLLSNRIRRRLKAGDFSDFDAYYRYLTAPQGAGELAHFLDAITTNETFFFRTPNHFEWLKTEFLSELLVAERRDQRQRALRIWSAGCSSGAEAYSIAICLTENMFRLRDWSLTILGTDISEEALHAAREAVFKSRAIEAVSENQLRRYFQSCHDESKWQVRPEIREIVQFENHNLMTPMRHTPFDCVFIRNVLIYFDRASKQTVVSNLFRALAPGGYLVVGPSEGIYDMLDPFKKQSAFLYQKP